MLRFQTSPRVEAVIQVILYLLTFLGSDLSPPWGNSFHIMTPTGSFQQSQDSPLTSHQRGSEPTLLPQHKEVSGIPSGLSHKGRCVGSVISGQPHNAFQLESPDCYTIGLITALPIELAAVEAMLDEEHLQPDLFEQSKTDNTVYSWGRIGHHNVVIAAPKKGLVGKANAATVAGGLIASLTSIRIGLLIGIGGGIPSPELDPDIRLGDVVVSAPAGTAGGVIEYDLGKEHILGFERRGFLNSPPAALLSAVTRLEAKHERGKENISRILDEALERNSEMVKAYQFPGWDMDVLFPATYDHVGPPDCSNCDHEKKISRIARESTAPKVHYGVIASALQKEGVEPFAFEMEAAGLMNNFPCLVVRGICDYADSHKSNRWQRYAAMTAAAYTKELLRIMPSREIEVTPRAIEAINELKANVGEVKNGVFRLRESIDMRAIKEWLHPPDPSENYNRAQEARHKGTGSWLLNDDRFVSWEAGDLQHLWIHGIMGCGKTVLAAMLIQHLREDCLYFFFDHTTKMKQDFPNLLRSLVYQLYIKEESLRDSTHWWFSSHEEGSRQPLMKSLLETFDFGVRKLGHVTIVLDALDECETLQELLQWMEELSYNGTSVRFILTSRREPDIEFAITRWIPETSILEIKSGNVSKDIRAYVGDHIRSDIAFKRWSSHPEVQEEIIAELMQKSDGMFRLAVLQLQELGPCFTIHALRRQLCELPRTLTAAYTNIISRVPDNHKDDALRILQLLAFSLQPLNIEAVTEFLAFDPNSLEYNPARRMPDSGDILRLCQGLIQLGKGSGGLPHGYETREFTSVSLAHLSVKEFLIPEDTDGQLGGSCFERAANKQLARFCLAYIAYVRARSPKEAKRNQLLHEAVLAEYPFLEYATFALFSHIIKARALNEFRDQLADVWINEFDVDYTSAIFLKSLLYAFYAIIPLDIEVVKELMAGVKKLIDGGADLDTAVQFFGTPLFTAAIRGLPKEFMKLLLDTGADMNAVGVCGIPAPQPAFFKGRRDTVELLLQKGAGMGVGCNNPFDIANREPLSDASRSGDLDMMQLLINYGADVNGACGTYPLVLACENNDIHAVRLLVNNGARVDIESDLLALAINAGNEELFNFLYANGAVLYGETFDLAVQANMMAGDALDKEALQLAVEEDMMAVGTLDMERSDLQCGLAAPYFESLYFSLMGVITILAVLTVSIP